MELWGWERSFLLWSFIGKKDPSMIDNHSRYFFLPWWCHFLLISPETSFTTLVAAGFATADYNPVQVIPGVDLFPSLFSQKRENEKEQAYEQVFKI